MPIGINKVVPRFVRGHIYKIYPQNKPEHYVIVRFVKLGYKNVVTLKYDAYDNHKLLTTYVKRQAYKFIPVATNIKRGNKAKVTTNILLTTIANRVVEEIQAKDLPLYLDTLFKAPEFERIFKGKRIPYIRRRKRRNLPGSLKILNVIHTSGLG